MVKVLIGLSNEMNKCVRHVAGDKPMGPIVESILKRSIKIRNAARELGITLPTRHEDGRGKYSRDSKD